MTTTRSQITLGCALIILSLTGATARAAASGSSLPRGFPAWLVARATQPWLARYDPRTDWNFTHAGTAAQRECLRTVALPIPLSDVPTIAQVPGFASCNSEALYYGFAGKPDYVDARQCAYLERALGVPRPISGSIVLSMIYANGVSVKRNLQLATKFACEAGGAPMEINARISDLNDRAAVTAQPLPPFDFCDDITSGHMAGVCTGVAASYRDAGRDRVLVQIASTYTPIQRVAFAALRDAAANYFNKHAINEVDLVGTERGVFWIEDIEHSWDGFLRDLRAMEADGLPSADGTAVDHADARMKALYQLVLADPSLRRQPPRELPPPGIPVMGRTVSREGIRADRDLWLAYRDAWLHFAAVRKPALSHDTVQAWITNQRSYDLRCLLPVGAPGARDCTRASLLPSNMRE